MCHSEAHMRLPMSWQIVKLSQAIVWIVIKAFKCIHMIALGNKRANACCSLRMNANKLNKINVCPVSLLCFIKQIHIHTADFAFIHGPRNFLCVCVRVRVGVRACARARAWMCVCEGEGGGSVYVSKFT